MYPRTASQWAIANCSRHPEVAIAVTSSACPWSLAPVTVMRTTLVPPSASWTIM